MATNSQYDSPGPIFGSASGYADSGAPGSSGVQDAPAGVGGGSVLAEAVVSAPFGTSQLPANLGRVPVTAGDTAGMADDLAAHTSEIMPGPLGDYLSTGAGRGGAKVNHPNSGA